MIDLVRNPPDFERTYLESLNACFPGWGGQRAYDWAFRRCVSGPAADLMVLKEGGVLLAGSAVTYRTLRTATGHEALVGIMTGSWTLPAARGKGCFTRVIEESVALTRERGGALLLAFVTETNASFRRLEAVGAALFPTRYVFSTPETPAAGPAPSLRVVEGPSADPAEWFQRFTSRRSHGATFTYASPEEWRSQFLDRPGATSIVDAGEFGSCVVEEHGEFDRLQGLAPARAEAVIPLVRAVLARAQHRNRKLFLFSASPGSAEVCATQLGLGMTSGFLTVLPAEGLSRNRGGEQAPALQAVDLRGELATPLEPGGAAVLASGPTTGEALRASPALVEWALHSGDRM